MVGVVMPAIRQDALTMQRACQNGARRIAHFSKLMNMLKKNITIFMHAARKPDQRWADKVQKFLPRSADSSFECTKKRHCSTLVQNTESRGFLRSHPMITSASHCGHFFLSSSCLPRLTSFFHPRQGRGKDLRDNHLGTSGQLKALADSPRGCTMLAGGMPCPL